MQMENVVTLKLSANEAIVLFDFLSREFDDNKANRIRTIFESDSEYWALNSVYGQLEKTLVEPFRSDYKKILEKARITLIESNGIVD
ncbi:MAG: hypothetical protein KDJ64_07800 [Nitratireductor sp.]|nr:hypothetical protein [Nitratireductor sp.]